MPHRRALVTGATGVVGRNLLAHLVERGGWEVAAVSRRKPDVPGDYAWIAADLLDPNDTRDKLGSVTGITHAFFSAYVERPDQQALVRDNVAMLTNFVEVVEAANPGLEHVHLTEGTKWYGSHLGRFKTPAKEDDPRHMPPNFYYSQQDWLAARQQGKRWTWSAARPHAVCGFATGNPMNLVNVVAVYATISKALGLPLSHPGSVANHAALYQVTDAGLLARAMAWMATSPQCANEAFNITNGDVFRWENLWPRLAAHFGMALGPQRKISLVERMADKGPLWEELVRRHGLVPNRYEDIAAWKYGDFVFSAEWDIISHPGKARRFGFHESVDSEDMFLRFIDDYRAARIIP